MFTAVFWNIGGKTTRDGIVRLITALQRQEDADVIALAECSDGVVGSVLRALNSANQSEWEWIPTRSRVQVLLRQRNAQLIELDWHEYYSILELGRLQAIPLLLAVTHMVSRVRKEFDDIDEELGAFADAVRNAEARIGHTNTVLIGDLNANPFANGLVLPRALHAAMPIRVAEQASREVSHRRWPYFFNPMWRFFGDGSTSPPGTCYYAPEGSHRAFHWNMFDQVLLRPALLPHYRDDSVRIVHTLGTESLTKGNWIPDREVGSDHLPIRVRLGCEVETVCPPQLLICGRRTCSRLQAFQPQLRSLCFGNRAKLSVRGRITSCDARSRPSQIPRAHSSRTGSCSWHHSCDTGHRCSCCTTGCNPTPQTYKTHTSRASINRTGTEG